MIRPTAAFCALLALAAPASAQTQKSDPPPAADFTPLVSPVLPPNFLPRSSTITPGSISGDAVTPYSSTPGYDARREAPAPGLRLTIPTR